MDGAQRNSVCESRCGSVPGQFQVVQRLVRLRYDSSVVDLNIVRNVRSIIVRNIELIMPVIVEPRSGDEMQNTNPLFQNAMFQGRCVGRASRRLLGGSVSPPERAPPVVRVRGEHPADKMRTLDTVGRINWREEFLSPPSSVAADSRPLGFAPAQVLFFPAGSCWPG